MRFSEFLLSTTVGLALLPLGAWCQKITSPEVHADKRVTFRLKAPNVPDVKLWGEWILKFNTLEPMTKGDDGVWTATVGPLTPGIYTYTFVIDHLGVPDPGNHVRVGDDGSMVEVPAASTPALYDPQAVPHGVLHMVQYQTTHRPGVQTVIIYTPPSYEKDGGTQYPALYLLHGSGDTETAWTHVGRAHFITDNLLAQGRAKPVILVMPNGFGSQFEQELVDDIIPMVESRYRVKRGAANRAVAGLSMGGFQALAIAMRRPEVFGSIGIFSAGAHGESADGSVRDFAADKRRLANGSGLFRIVIGDRDSLMKDATRLDQLLKDNGVAHEFVVAPGEGHRWLLWRQCLADLIPSLFRDAR